MSAGGQGVQHESVHKPEQSGKPKTWRLGAQRRTSSTSGPPHMGCPNAMLYRTQDVMLLCSTSRSTFTGSLTRALCPTNSALLPMSAEART